MSDTRLEVLDGRQVLVTGVTLPDPPPQRVYLGGRSYTLAAPRVPLPPIVNVVKTVLNWASNGGAIAKNVLHILFPAGAVASDATQLKSLANHIMTFIRTSHPLPPLISSQWQLLSITCSDLGGSSAVATSDVPLIAGSEGSGTTPPQVSVALSWQIAETYRGGKPRTYLPGIPQSALVASSGSGVIGSYATALKSFGDAWIVDLAGFTTAGSGHMTLGTVSYHTGHAVRPTPLFRAFISSHVHERLDSQRRRSGKESTFPSTP